VCNKCEQSSHDPVESVATYRSLQSDTGIDLEGSQSLLRAQWAAAWFREYQCQTRYLAMLALEMVEEHALRCAWLAWWHANCACREAEARLEKSIYS
jgi:hypothetical protein